MVMSNLQTKVNLLAREIVFRTVCRHRPGARRNILLYCSRRGGSTWLLATIAAHPGIRYVGRPFLTVLQSRWRRRMPDLAAAAGHDGTHRFRQIVHFSGQDERRFRALAQEIISGRLPIYPTLAFRQPYFHRVTDRIVFQMTAGPPLIEWFDRHFDVMTAVLFRHPIPTSLSVAALGWPHECCDFLYHQWFVDTHLSGKQVDLARRILDSGSPLARHVLDWTLKMLIPYRVLGSDKYPAWVAVTYEQMVTEPDRVLEHIAGRLDLPDLEAMRTQLRRPSRTVTQSTAQRTDDVEYLLSRWRKRVTSDQEQTLLAIPRAFGITLYEPGRNTAREYLVP